MTEQNAINSAESKSIEYGGIWHVVKLNGEFYDVHDSWFKIHTAKPVYTTPDYFKTPLIIGKQSLWRRVVTTFNKGLLWLFGRFINATRISHKA